MVSHPRTSGFVIVRRKAFQSVSFGNGIEAVQHQPAQNFLPGKPIFPVITENGPFLLDLIGERSWLLFDRLKLQGSQDWMQLQPKYWNLMEEYRKERDFLSTLEAVNDSAERGIKLITDFKDMVKKEEQLQFFQVMKDHRQRISFGGKKATLDAV
ncbi:hypothetical protein DAPPUDRAFT_106824 [Daphnia pulex]|uniref:Uncharacterized protein n=1 Tax=Daphnia pulex TaxID=6669 RepID=E9GV24_DAPPU|nr:hypothetical protein DAPPUDRAFT_106824 [Daphnia pulex]|eukprot:EFX76590.1 hypothetical protein DAPPUDRAFT_106824 [Daphnia pulex]